MVTPTNIQVTPPKSPDTQSAFDLMETDALRKKMDELRAYTYHNGGGQRALNGVDESICLLMLDMGYTGEEMREILAEGFSQLAREAAAYKKDK